MKLKFWKTDALEAQVHAATARNLELAALTLQIQLKAAVERPNHTGKSPSLPGEPPKKVTARLHDNVAYEIDRKALVAYVGIREVVPYALMLEFGTSRVAPRPWIRPTWARVQSLLNRILAQP